MPWKHCPAPIKGMVTDRPPVYLGSDMSPYLRGVYIKDGEVVSDFGYTDYPSTGNTATNELNGAIMKMTQFYMLDGTSSLIAFTATQAYKYNTSSDTWDCITQGTEIDDCEAQWDAQANVTSTADTTIKMRDSKSAKHVIAAGFTTGIISSEDMATTLDLSGAANTYISFWIRADAAVAANVLQLRICEDTGGAATNEYATFNIPALVANTWQHVRVNTVVAGGTTWPDDFDSVDSVALVAASDPGAITVYIDDIRTTKCFTGDEDNRFSVATMNDVFIVTNGVDQPQKYTGSGVFADLTTTLATGSITTSEVVISFKDHLFLMNNTENAADAPQRVSWTNIGATEDWTAGTSGYQDLVDDSSWIITAEQMSDNEVIIYKERSIVKMIWVGGQTPFRFETMVANASIFGKEAITSMEGVHVVAGSDFLYRYNGGGNIKPLDAPSKKTMYDSMDRTYSNRMFIANVEEDDELQFWIPVSTEYLDEVWCYNTASGSWYVKYRTMTGFGFYQRQDSFTIGDLVGNIGDQNWRFGDALTKANTPITLVGDSNGKVYQLDKNTMNNDGTAITSEVQTPDFVLPDNPNHMNRFMRVPQLIFEARGNSVTTTYSTDGGSTWSPTQGGGTNVTTLGAIHNQYQQDFDAICRKIRFKFLNNTVSSGFHLRYYGFYWILRSGRK